jgi:F-box/WD-40 domain protein MET30
MCEQHINKKCTKCGWGLPLMSHQAIVAEKKRPISPIKPSSSKKICPDDRSCIKVKPLNLPVTPMKPVTLRPWKHIFAERSVVARNWKNLNFQARNLIGHIDSVKSLYYDEANSFLVSASSDCTMRAWNVDTGVCIGILKGHTMSVRGVQFDDSKIVSCSMDKTIRIWSRKTFGCVRVIESITF